MTVIGPSSDVAPISCDNEESDDENDNNYGPGSGARSGMARAPACRNHHLPQRGTFAYTIPPSPHRLPTLPHASHRLLPHRVRADRVHNARLLTSSLPQAVVLKAARRSHAHMHMMSWTFAAGASPLLALVF